MFPIDRLGAAGLQVQQVVVERDRRHGHQTGRAAEAGEHQHAAAMPLYTRTESRECVVQYGPVMRNGPPRTQPVQSQHRRGQKAQHRHHAQQYPAAGNDAEFLHPAKIGQHDREECQRRGARPGQNAGDGSFEDDRHRAGRVMALDALLLVAGHEVHAEIVGQAEQHRRDEDRDDREVADRQRHEPQGPTQADEQGRHDADRMPDAPKEEHVQQRDAGQRDERRYCRVVLRAQHLVVAECLGPGHPGAEARELRGQIGNGGADRGDGVLEFAEARGRVLVGLDHAEQEAPVLGHQEAVVVERPLAAEQRRPGRVVGHAVHRAYHLAQQRTQEVELRVGELRGFLLRVLAQPQNILHQIRHRRGAGLRVDRVQQRIQAGPRQQVAEDRLCVFKIPLQVGQFLDRQV